MRLMEQTGRCTSETYFICLFDKNIIQTVQFAADEMHTGLIAVANCFTEILNPPAQGLLGNIVFLMFENTA